MAGLEPAPLKLAPERSLALKLPLLMVEDNQLSSAHRNHFCIHSVTCSDSAFASKSRLRTDEAWDRVSTVGDVFEKLAELLEGQRKSPREL